MKGQAGVLQSVLPLIELKAPYCILHIQNAKLSGFKPGHQVLAPKSLEVVKCRSIHTYTL